MATVIMVDTPNMTAEQYDAVLETLGGSLPEACRVHIAGPSPQGGAWRVVTVWDDPIQAREFMTNKVRPAQEQAGVTPVESAPTMWEAHNVLV